MGRVSIEAISDQACVQFSVTSGRLLYVPYRVTASPTQDYEPGAWAKMLGRQERIDRFWRYVKGFGFERKDLSLFANDERDNTDPKRRLLMHAFLTFAREVFIEVASDSQQPAQREELDTTIQEQIRWELQFIALAKSLDISVFYTGPRTSDDEPEERACFVNHRDEGFEGQQVYIWDGHYKGKLGRVKQMNGGACWVDLESVLFGVNTIVIDGQLLLAYVF